MKLVKIGEAKTHLSRILEYVRRGGRVRILDRETPVADLIPVDSLGGAGEDDRMLAELERRGVVRRGKRGPLPRELLRPGPADPQGKILAALLEERSQSR